MSCCPATPLIKVSSGVGFIDGSQESDIVPGESVECYGARAGNQSGKLDDATENVLDKIENTSIPIDASNVSVNVTFRLTTGSTRTPTSWTLTVDGSPWSEPGVLFTSSGVTATLIGTFGPSAYDKPYEVLLTANDGSEIDARTFKFSPSKRSNTNSIQLISPLPGAIVNSKFGPRLHPIDKVMKMHSGIDMKYTDRSTKDVVAAADGEVIFSGINGTLKSGYGNCVKIKHINGSGQFLCLTLYGHMSKLYVSVGDKVSAGQKIGHEGSTGGSSGNHLHFELRLPDGKAIDPVPYIRDTLNVADVTAPNGDPVSSASVSHGGAAITASGVAAQTTPCPAPGINPATKAAAPAIPPYVPPGVPSADPFERAWYFTMTFEVGPHWMTTAAYSPGDPELDAGLYGDVQQRKKVGYKPGPNYPGGDTKFGVAQDPNKSKVVVNDLTYDAAKSFGKSNYWSVSGSTNCAALPDLVAVMMFDINYLHGIGGARRIYDISGQVGAPSGTQAEQLAICEAVTAANRTYVSGMNPKYVAGWLNRINGRLAYVKSLPFPLA